MGITFENNFDELIDNINSLSGDVSFDVLFTTKFMKKHTNFNSFDELLEAGNFIVNSQEDFEAIPDKDFDLHILNNTKFSSWDDMLTEAGESYVASALDL